MIYHVVQKRFVRIYGFKLEGGGELFKESFRNLFGLE